MNLAARLSRLETVHRPERERAEQRARLAAVLNDPLVRPLVDRVEAAYDAEPPERRVGGWHQRVRIDQPTVYVAWLVVTQVIAERLGGPPPCWSVVWAERRRAAAELRRASGLGEMPEYAR